MYYILLIIILLLMMTIVNDSSNWWSKQTSFIRSFEKVIKIFFPDPKILSPKRFIWRLLKNFPDSRRDKNLELQYPKVLNLYYHPKITDFEKILVLFLWQKDDFFATSNEIPHWVYLSALEGKRCYFVYVFNHGKIMDPKKFKMGDIIVYGTEKKYEIKTYKTLCRKKIEKIIFQYSENDFIKNNMHFSILIEEEGDITKFEAKAELSKGLNIPEKHILIYNKEDIKALFNTKEDLFKVLDLYNEAEKKIVQEQKECGIINLENMLKYAKIPLRKKEVVKRALLECKKEQRNHKVDLKLAFRLINTFKKDKYEEVDENQIEIELDDDISDNDNTNENDGGGADGGE